MNDKRKLFAAVLVALMASLPASCLLTGADADDDGGPASPYDQLTANEKAVYDGIASYSAGKLTVTVALANPVYTASATDGDAEAYLEAEAASMIKAASYVLSMEDPFAICTWGGSGVVFDLGSQTVVRTSGLIGLNSLVLTAAIDEAYADDPATEDVDELRRRFRRLPWARPVLELIEAHPATVSTELAEQLGMERLRFKERVRRLKALGLTESLEVGYRLSPRGQAFLDELRRL